MFYDRTATLVLYFTGITTYISYRTRTQLTETASVAQSVERWSGGPGFNFQPEALEPEALQIVIPLSGL